MRGSAFSKQQLGMLMLLLHLLLNSLTVWAQPLSDQQKLTLSPTPTYPLYNYTLGNQTLYTACPCLDRWQFTKANGSVVEVSGCANPDNDTAGPFCQIDDSKSQCPFGETLTMSNGGRRMRVVACLPQRTRTLAGCLCSAYWSERDDISLSRSWPIMPRDLMQQGLHRGWLLAGNCSRALNLPGGARCTVLEGTCSSMPAKGYPPPSPSTFWQITSNDPQGWDFCADPAYDQQRAVQPNSTAEALAALPANVRSSVKTVTQSGCSCSPLNWTYYPNIIRDENQPLQAQLGCANPDNDPLGAWCPVDPAKCPSYYGAKQSEPGNVPASRMYRYYFDYCGPVRNKTEAGCLCMGNWKPTFNSTLESKPNPNAPGILPDPTRITLYSGGVCGNPPELKRERSWCYVDYRTCQNPPAGTANDLGELFWDFCPAGTPPAVPAVTATAALPAAATAAAGTAGGVAPPAPATAAAPAPGPVASPAASPGLYIPPSAQPPAAAPESPGLYLPHVSAPAPASSPTPTEGAVTREAGPAPAAAATAAGQPGPVTPGLTAQQQQQGKPAVPAAAIAVPVAIAAAVAAALAGFLVWRRKHKQRLRRDALDWASHLSGMGPSGSGGDEESGNSRSALQVSGPASTGGPGLFYGLGWGSGGGGGGGSGSNGQGAGRGGSGVKYGPQGQYFSKADAPPTAAATAAAGQGAAAHNNYPLVGALHDPMDRHGGQPNKDAAALSGQHIGGSAGGSAIASYPASVQSSATGSQVPLFGLGGLVGRDSAAYPPPAAAAAAAAGNGAGGFGSHEYQHDSLGSSASGPGLHSASGSSGLPSGPGGGAAAAAGNVSAFRRSNDWAAAAAAEAERKAASLAALWESDSAPPPAAAAAAAGLHRSAPAAAAKGAAASGAHAYADGALLPTHFEGQEQQQYPSDMFKQQQQQQQQYGHQKKLQQQQLKGGEKPGPVARIFSSPFAAESKMLPQLASVDPDAATTTAVAPHSADNRALATSGAMKQQQHQQQQQQSGLEEPALSIVAGQQQTASLSTIGGAAPPTPQSKDVSRIVPSNRDEASSTQTAAASDAGSKGWTKFSWLFGGGGGASSSPGDSHVGGSVYSGAGDTQLSGLTGMSYGGTNVGARSGSSASSKGPTGAAAAAGSGAIGMCQSVAAPATRHLSGPIMDPNWDFDRAHQKPVRVLLQVMEEPDVAQPVTLLLLVSAPPPRPDVLAQIVLPKDPPMAGVDLAIDANRDLAFPSNSFLGQGAFGQVHRALYKGRHPVAVKMLTDPDLRCVDSETLRSFREELSIMAKLDHPHIVRCYGGNLEGANPFIVTELCECSLDKMIGHYKRKYDTGMPLKNTLTIGLHIASALWHMHPSVVHRDLKPQNVLLDIAGTAKVTDFGLSRMKTHTFVTTQHVEAGTASYMAPECFGSGGVSEKVDVYALGMLLWECVTGVRPWKGCNLVQVAFQVAMAGNRPELPQPDPRHCPAELVQLIADCWAANPKERPSSGEVMKALAQMIRVYTPN